MKKFSKALLLTILAMTGLMMIADKIGISSAIPYAKASGDRAGGNIAIGRN